MKQQQGHLQEDVRSGQYFLNAMQWYKNKYIHPFSERSVLLVLSLVVCLLFLALATNISKLFPAVLRVKYTINVDDASGKAARIVRANTVINNPLASLTEILLRNYVLNREQYDYEKMKKQFIYMKNNSTRIVFRKFYNFMDISNPSSPVIRYQKNAKRIVNIVSIEHVSMNKAVVIFQSQAKNNIEEILDDSLWQSTIDFEIDQLDAKSSADGRFNFTVTNYQSQQLKSNNE